MTVLEVNGLKTQFRTREGVVKAVDDVSFKLAEGETLGIVGESGSGKSCTMLSIMRLIQQPPGEIVAGEALFAGRDLMELSDREMRAVRGNGISMIFQDPMTSLNPLLTVSTQIGEVLRLHMHMDKHQSRQRTIELLGLVGISEPESRLDNYPHQLSGGMRQRVMIAIGLACNPDVLIADEPTTALDVTIQAQIVDLIKRLQADIGMSIIWISHDLGVVAGLVDRVMVMYAGHVVEEAAVDQLYYEPKHPYTIGLLECLPRIDNAGEKKLTAIEGLPPMMIDSPAGCPFRTRCTRAVEKCSRELPVLQAVGPGHRVACWEVQHHE
ncbi:MAG: ABC transporter ATP-binding protein [Gammaproteobacteria bacterium]|nr:ABC transporter ATP-binding protein [Gammaproteobacteria bacterium]